MKTFKVLEMKPIIGDYVIFTFSRVQKYDGKIIDTLNLKAKVIDTDENDNFTFEVEDGGYSKLTSGKPFDVGARFTVKKTTHTNKIIINKQTFLRLDVGTTKINRYETVKIFIRGFISRLYLRMVAVVSKRSDN